MLEERAPASKRKPYTKPKIITLEVDLSLASAATKLEGILALENPPRNPDTQPGADKTKAARVDEKS